MKIIVESIFMILVGTVILRLAGRKSISQMTVSQTVIMFSVGSIVIQPIIGNSIVKTMIASASFVAGLLLLEWLQIKFNFFENMLTGKAVVVIEKGQVKAESLKKLRLSVDQLEIRLRQLGIANMEDVEIATLETNGQLGYELTREAKPVTVGDLEKMLPQLVKTLQKTAPEPIFAEVQTSRHASPHSKNLK